MSSRHAVRRALDALALTVVIVSAVVLLGSLMRRPESPSTTIGQDLSFSEFSKLISTGQWLGPRNAPAVLLVYNDYQCGFCAELFPNLVTLMGKYPQHFAVVLKQFVEPAFTEGFSVALGAECAGDQGRLEAYSSAAFRNAHRLHYTDSWSLLADEAYISNVFAFGDCVRSRLHADRLLGYWREAQALGIDGTPSMFLNGRRFVGAPAPHVLDSIVATYIRR
jgi:protein-disulfide isomerase